MFFSSKPYLSHNQVTTPHFVFALSSHGSSLDGRLASCMWISIFSEPNVLYACFHLAFRISRPLRLPTWVMPGRLLHPKKHFPPARVVRPAAFPRRAQPPPFLFYQPPRATFTRFTHPVGGAALPVFTDFYRWSLWAQWYLPSYLKPPFAYPGMLAAIRLTRSTAVLLRLLEGAGCCFL